MSTNDTMFLTVADTGIGLRRISRHSYLGSPSALRTHVLKERMAPGRLVPAESHCRAQKP